jgi:ketosteroid isomerase-like protein
MSDGAAVVQAAYEAFGKGDIEGVLAMLSPDVEWSAPATLPQGGHFTGLDGALEFFKGLVATWDPLSLDVEAVGEVGPGLVAGIVRGSGSLRDGSPASYGAVHIFNVKDGKVIRFREYVDLDRAIGS